MLQQRVSLRGPATRLRPCSMQNRIRSRGCMPGTLGMGSSSARTLLTATRLFVWLHKHSVTRFSKAQGLAAACLS